MWSNQSRAAFLVALSLSAGCGPVEEGITVVSIQFDDLADTQLIAAAALEKHDMRATFFVNDAAVNTPKHLTVGDLLTLQENGHEIGGHTIDHANLPFLTYEDQRKQVCENRFRLQSFGLEVDSFAYPAGFTNGASEAVVEECGYESGRRTGELCETPSLIRDVFARCDRAERLPPIDRFHTRSYGSIRIERIPDRVRNIVKEAENHGGGWVQLIFHYICDGCDPYGVSEAEFNSFLDFLAEEREAGRVRIHTVREVIRGEALSY